MTKHSRCLVARCQNGSQPGNQVASPASYQTNPHQGQKSRWKERKQKLKAQNHEHKKEKEEVKDGEAAKKKDNKKGRAPAKTEQQLYCKEKTGAKQ